MGRPHLGEHVPVLDGVRGIAILLVLLFHFGQYGHGLPAPSVLVDKAFYKACQAGWVGVDLFFVLSGFLITGILYDSKEGSHYFRNFYARRCLRIFPLYYATIFFFLICLPRLWPFHEGMQYLTRDRVWYWTYLSNVLVAYKGWYWFGVLDHFWSLAVEEQFYLVWPVVILVFTRLTLVRISLALIAAALVVRIALRLSGYEIAAYVLSPARIDALAVGALLALIARGPYGLSRLAPFALPAAGLTASAVALIGVWRHGFPYSDLVVGTIGHTVLACLFAATLVMGLTSSPSSALGRWLASPILTFFGRYSYALYVFHNPLLFFRPSFLSFTSIPQLLGSQLPALLLYIMLAILVCVGLALLSWHVYEKQFLKLKRFFPYPSNPRNGSMTPVLQGQLSSVTSS